jgi:hypothetical protein
VKKIKPTIAPASGDLHITPPSAHLRLTPATPVFAAAPTLAQVLAKGKKVQYVDLAHLLAAITTFYTAFDKVPTQFQSDTNAPVPVEVLTLVGKVLVGHSEWAKVVNEARAEAARGREVQLQCEAEKHWQKNSKLSPEAVAEKIVADPVMRPIITIQFKNGVLKIMKASTIRRMIKRPQK